MRWFSMLAIFMVASAAALAAGLWIWHGKSQILYERDRATLEWQSAKLAEKVYSVGAIPDAWGAGLFLSDRGLLAAASTLKGMRIASEKDDVTLTFGDLSIRSKPSFLEVEIALSATSPSRNAALKAKVVAELVFAGISQKDKRTAILRFGLIPIEIVPEVGWYGFDLKGGKLASDLIAGELLAELIGSAPIELPVPNGVSADLGGERTGTAPINKDLGSKLTYSLTLHPIKLAQELKAVSPLFLKGGLWLLASDKPIDGISRLQDPAGRSQEILVRETKEIQSKLEVVGLPADDAVVWIGSELLLSAANRVAALPPDLRSVSFRSTKVEGRIAEKKWRDDVLGDGGAFAEFVDNNSVTGSALVNRLTPKWIADVGLDVETRVDVHADAKVHVHVDPLIGGGVGTSVGLVGNASAGLGATIAFTADAVDGARVLVARPKGRCGSLTVELKTDGKAKTDFGWMTVPSIGIIRHQPIDLSVMAPAPIFDDLPRTIDGWNTDGSARVVDLKTRKVTVEPAWRYMRAKIAVMDAKATTSGWLVGAELEVAPSQHPVDATVLAQQRDKIRAAIAQPGPSSCADDGSTEITFGDVRIGPNNEIVKFMVSIGKFTKEMANRIPREVNKEKLKEWINDPPGSFGRSDPGKAAGTVVNTVKKPVRNYCKHNWCP
ncbi:hypothetical protein QEV83_14580 [Methylocapsa sp. D3K7]|uniref:hypothetical protein n=1 Tax=Methylocapsa sp. D3K7 TaxID=3041435 RepID=UPI00244E7FFC|nr:hypothetical protein [Methylocapsa sp. D3K7]WGJ13885.1 hypothetical protein QEV83_14580 [Methylocapsa sp. D3K7]